MSCDGDESKYIVLVVGTDSQDLKHKMIVL